MKTSIWIQLAAKAALAAVSLFSLATTALAQNFTSFDLVVPTSANSVVTTIDGTGRIMPANRSYVIGLAGGSHGPLVFSNWTGSSAYPVIVVNQSGAGRVVVADVSTAYANGIEVNNCSFFQLRGDNDPAYRYGIEIAHAGLYPSSAKRGLICGATTTNLEIAFLEIHHTGFAGIMAKTDPIESDPSTWSVNFTMYDLKIHDNYIHHTGAEGMYIGYSSWAADQWPEAPGPEAHEIYGLKVFNNLIENTNWDGMQYGCTPDPTAEVFNNVIIHTGLAQNSAQCNGLVVESGSSGKLHDNVIIDCFGNNIAIFGRGYNTVYNNLLIAGSNGIFSDNRPNNPVPTDPNARQTIRGSDFSIYNNTIINPLQYAFWTMSEVTVNNFNNNLSVVPNGSFTDAFASGSASFIASNNVLLTSTDGVGFVNPTENDFRILSTSSAINAGMTLPEAPADFQGLPRTAGGTCDAGWSEFGALSVYLVSAPPATGTDGVIKASAIGGTSPYTYAWSTGATTQTISSLLPGLYSVTVTDAVGAKMTRATYLFTGASMGAPVAVTPPTQVLAPTFSPAGGTFATAQTVTVSSATAGSSIRYTTDGSVPSSTTGTLYGGPVVIGYSSTLKAIAYKSGLSDSTVATATYIVSNGPVDTKFTPTVTESSHTSSNTAALTIDGDLNTRWASSGDGEWLQYDLGTNRRVAFLNIAFYLSATRIHTFDLLGSTDNTTWTTILLGAHSSYATGLQNYDIPDVDPVRYLRIVCHGSSYNATLNSINEVEIWGGASGSLAAPTITTQPQSQTANIADNVSFSVTATGAPAPAYQWRKDGVVISGATSSSLNLTNVQAGNAGGYSVSVTNSAGAVTSNTATLTMAGSAPTITTQPQSQTVNVGNPVTFSVVATGTPAPTYQWKKAGTVLSGATSASYVISSAQTSDAAAYTVDVTNAYGSVTSASATLTVNIPPLGLILEAESATLVGALAKSNQPNYSGSGFADYINASGDYVEWTFTNPTAATRTLGFQYASTGSARNLSISVNGTVVNSALAFTSTGNLTIWAMKTMTVSLPAGTITIRATATGTSGPNMDYLRID